MGMEQGLADFRTMFERMAPAGRAALTEAKTDDLRTNFPRGAAATDDTAPHFASPGASGRLVDLHRALRGGPVALTFCLGGWRPDCDIQLQAHQRGLGGEARRNMVALNRGVPAAIDRRFLSKPALVEVGRDYSAL
jgi:hypothetical protein